MSKELGSLSGPQIRAGITAVALFLCMLLPWYRKSVPSPTGKGFLKENVNAFGAFSWVEAAVLLVSGSILYLLWSRTQKKAFHLPGGDGMAVTIGGFWCLFLLIWRLFDRPDIDVGSVGVQWGLFVTMGVAFALGAAGQRMRAEHKPEPPNPAAEDPTWDPDDTERAERRRRREQRRPVDSASVTRVLGEERPSWEGEPPEPPSRGKRAEPPDEGRLF